MMEIEQVIHPFESSTVKPFCDCNFPSSIDIRDNIHEYVNCSCGEDINLNESRWEWDDSLCSDSYISGKNVTFHPIYSTGTSIVRGKVPLKKGMIHYWEIRILSQLSGTDQVRL